MGLLEERITYHITEAKNKSGFVDNDSIPVNRLFGNGPATLVRLKAQGIGQNVNPTNNRTTTVSTTHLGDDNTIAYYQGTDNSRAWQRKTGL